MPDDPLLTPQDLADLLLMVIAFFASTVFNMLWLDWTRRMRFWKAFRGATRYGLVGASLMGLYLVTTDTRVSIPWIIVGAGILSMISREDLRGIGRSLAKELAEGLIKVASRLMKWSGGDNK